MSLKFEVLRPADLLAFRIETRNLRLKHVTPKKSELVIDKLGKPAYLIFHFPPQSITEKAYFEASTPAGSDPLDAPGQVACTMSGPTRLVFRVPANSKPIPFAIASLLDWSKLKLVTSPVADATGSTPAGSLQIAPPKPLESAIELPYRLFLSPKSNVGWAHSQTEVTHAGRTELWHTRLARLVAQKGKPGQKLLREATELSPVPLRAIWSPDFVDHGPLPSPSWPFLTAMSPKDRDEIVILTSGFEGYFIFDKTGARKPYSPKPIGASRLFLSALGGWLTSRGHWTDLPRYDIPDDGTVTLDLSEWVHVATQGRDHYVKIVYEGFLYPFGHRAALIKVTERKFVGEDAGVVPSPVAYLRQREYVIVREPVKTYTDAPYVHGGLEMPLLKQVRIKTRVTPNIDNSATTGVPGASDSFWINVGGTGFPFHLEGIDLAGARIDFLGALIFMHADETTPAMVQTQYAASGDRRACLVHSRNIAYADPGAGDTTLKTTKLFFDTQLLTTTQPFLTVPFIPKLDDTAAAVVNIPAVAELLGTSPDITIHLFSQYLSSGIDSNAGVFAEINAPPGVAFTADKAGGFATPKLSVTGISARKGLVGGSTGDAAAGLIDPAQFFGDVSARLFGTIPLQSLIPIDAITKKADASVNAPEIRTQALPNRKHPQQIVTKVNWKPALQDFSAGPVTLAFNSDGNASELSLHATIRRPLDGSPPDSEINGKLSSFLITLLGVIGLKITSITFGSKNGSKTDVAAHLPDKDAVRFLGPLEFVQTLADIIPPGIFGGAGPAIDLKPTGIRVSYTLGLPPISIGVFSLEHIAITTGLDLPYLDGKPGFEFAFASRSKPFLITVECLGGGGFVHVVLNADGIQMVEGALEFGGQFSIDLGVASGGVHVMAGIYFQLKSTSTTLAGFVDIGGEVSVLGIISISIDLNLSLSYIATAQGSKVQGRATLTISVHVLFFSVSASVSVERSFGSGPGDPRVDQLIAPDDWAAYASAFA